MIIFLRSKFSFERLPSPLRANSQKAALKLISASRKLQNLMRVLSYDEVTLVTGLSAEKIYKIIAKSNIIEQKLLEGMPQTLQPLIECMATPSQMIVFYAVNLRLVHSIALQHQGMGLELEDLVFEGTRYLNTHKMENKSESKIDS